MSRRNLPREFYLLRPSASFLTLDVMKPSGDVYEVKPVAHTCTCEGFAFRRTCCHLQQWPDLVKHSCALLSADDVEAICATVSDIEEFLPHREVFEADVTPPLTITPPVDQIEFDIRTAAETDCPIQAGQLLAEAKNLGEAWEKVSNVKNQQADMGQAHSRTARAGSQPACNQDGREAGSVVYTGAFAVDAFASASHASCDDRNGGRADGFAGQEITVSAQARRATAGKFAIWGQLSLTKQWVNIGDGYPTAERAEFIRATVYAPSSRFVQTTVRPMAAERRAA